MWKTKISHILEVYDGYTGQPADAFKFCIASNQKFMWMPKDNGCIVFCDVMQAEFELISENNLYLSEHIILPDKAAHEHPEVQRVWVFPGKNYARNKWEILKQGEEIPLCRVEFFPIMKEGTLRLLQDVEKQAAALFIFHRKHENLEGRKILLYPQQIKVTLGEEIEPFCFTLKDAIKLEGKIKKSEVRVMLCYEGEVQADGSFQIAVPGNKSSLEKSILYLKGRKQEIIHQNK